MDRKPSIRRETKSARVCTRMVAADVKTGKKESRAEYAAPLAMLKQLSSNAATTLRRRSQGNVLHTLASIAVRLPLRVCAIFDKTCPASV